MYYPWRGGSTCASQRGMLIDRHKILEQNGYHLAPDTREARGIRPVGPASFDPAIWTVSAGVTRSSLTSRIPRFSGIHPAFSAEEDEDAPPEFSRTALRRDWLRLSGRRRFWNPRRRVSVVRGRSVSRRSSPFSSLIGTESRWRRNGDALGSPITSSTVRWTCRCGSTPTTWR